MAIVKLMNGDQKEIRDFKEAKATLARFGIYLDQWEAGVKFEKDANQETVLAAYEGSLKPYMEAGNYKTADVIVVNEDTPNLGMIRQKFLREHTHSEDEVRFIVEGEGLFWFHIEGQVLSVLCQRGDLIRVPANTKHWFDLGPKAHVKAIRIFTDPAGWVANYTESGIDSNYNPIYQ